MNTSGLEKKWLLMVFAAALLLRGAWLLAPVERNWRECHTAMQSRDIARSGWDWMHPKVDFLGPKLVTCAIEFPLYNWIWAVTDACLPGGQHHLLTGRILSLLFGLVSLTLLHRIALKWTNPQAALAAAALYATCPLAWHLEATGMLEALRQMLSLLGLWTAILWARQGRPWAIFVCLVSVGLSIAVKLPLGGWMGAGIGLVWMVERWRQGKGWWTPQIFLWAFPLGAAAAWYAYMHQMNLESEAPFNFTQQSVWIMGSWSQRFAPGTTTRFISRVFVYGGPVLLIAALMGLFQWRKGEWRKPGHLEILILVVVAVLYQYIVVNGCFVHKHYQYILAAPLALLGGVGLASFFEKQKITRLVGVILTISVLWSGAVYFKLWKDMRSPVLLQIAKELDEKTKPGEAIVVHVSLDYLSNPAAPFIFYLADRCGIIIPKAEYPVVDERDFARKGYAWLVSIDGQASLERPDGFSIWRIGVSKDE